MSDSNINNNVTNEDVTKALINLATRVAQLEDGTPLGAQSDSKSDLRPILVATLADLKVLRTSVITSKSEIDDKLIELGAMKEENVKLRYQIKHLQRSLEAAKE